MPKDVIIDDKPRIKLKPRTSCPFAYAREQQVFQENDIDLKDYRQLGVRDTVKKGDIYYSSTKKCYLTSLCWGHPGIVNTYWRKKEPKKESLKRFAPVIDLTQYEIPLPNDILQAGDEYYTGEVWVKTTCIDSPVDKIHTYRRRIP